MAFEFFFGVFGLISSDSNSHHKSRLDGDNRVFTPLSSNAYKDNLSQKTTSTTNPSGGSPVSYKSSDAQNPIFNITGNINGTLTNSNYADGILSSSSSASSISSSGSTTTLSSTATLLKSDQLASSNLASKDAINGKKYEYNSTLLKDNNTNYSKNLNLAGAANNNNNLIGSSKITNKDIGGDYVASAEAQQQQQQADGADYAPVAWTYSKRLRVNYCRIVCCFLWLNVLRILAGLVVEISMFTLDFYYLGPYRVHLLIPLLCLAIQAAANSLIFIRNNDETNWLVPFYSSKDYLIRSRSNFRPKMEDYTKRVNISVALALVFATFSSLSIIVYLGHSVVLSDPFRAFFEPNFVPTIKQQLTTTPAPGTSGSAPTTTAATITAVDYSLERMVLGALLCVDVLFAIYSTYICFLVSFYFNLISSIMKARFHGISKIIEDLAESNTTKTTNQARKITTLYLEHNEACELLDESNDFWQYLIFFTYFTYIPAYCYCLYNLFFVEFDSWPSFITWVIHTHTALIILLISFSAAGVSTETAAACASYFLIVADFSRSSVFSLQQMNATTAATTSAATEGITTLAPTT